MKSFQKIIPFLTPSFEMVQCQSWQMVEPSNNDLPYVLPEWDSATDIQVKRSIKVDLKNIWKSCELTLDDSIALVAEWASDGTSLRATSEKKLYLVGHQEGCEIELLIPGSELGQSITLSTRLVFFPGVIEKSSKLSPRIPGSILWQDEHKVLLEGEGSRFPMETINFEKLNGVPLNSSWHLSWMPYEPELQLSANARLYLNNNSDEVIKSLTDSKPSEKKLAIRRLIFWDVGRRLVRGMLENKDFNGRQNGYPLGSLGLAVTTMLELYLPNESIEGLRSLLKSNPDLFETVLQSAFEPLKG